MRLRSSAALSLILSASAILAAHQRYAHAENYELFIDIETEEELYDLLSDQQIGEDTFNVLLSLFQRGVDLNQASRDELYALPNLTLPEVDKILAYRREAGNISDPAVLSVNGIISDRKFLAIAPFLRVKKSRLSGYAVDGMVRAQTRWSSEDNQAPSSAVQARVATLGNLRMGFAGVLTRNRLGDVVYDPNRDSLAAEDPSSQLHAVKYYAMWDDDHLQAIAGTYRLGFGQRLTFDNTNQTIPNGIYTDDELTRSTDLTRRCKESRGELVDTPCDTDVYVTPDFRWSQRLMGAAVGLPHIELGSGYMQAYAFLSVQPKSIYQYEIYDRGICDDPRNDSDPACSAPDVYREQPDALAPTSRFSFSTLPDLYRETVAGGNVSFFATERLHVGVTGYAATIDWLAKGIDLDFQEWSRTPYGGGFGAVGMDFAWGGTAWLDVFGEVTRTMDNQAAGGGTGGILRAVAAWNKNKNELEASLRAYGREFANPFARPISAADERDGLRARDEVGGRLRFTGKIAPKVNVRSTADFWRTPSRDRNQMLLFARADVDLDRETRLGIWSQYQNKGLSDTGREQCFEISTLTDENGERIPCSGQKWQGAIRLRVQPSRLWFATVQAQLDQLDERRYSDKFRYDASAWAMVTLKPSPEVSIRARGRYKFDDIADNDFLEQSLWGYLDFTYRLPRRYRVRLRYDLFYRLDDRASTLARQPNPENWLWLEFESKF